MLPGQKYKELIQQNGELQHKIAQGWGYEINPAQFIPKRSKVQNRIKVVNMAPLKVVSDVPVSKRLQRIEEELLMMQNQRRLNLLTEEAKLRQQKGDKIQEESPAVKMMHQLVDQYNFIVGHRHITQKKSDKVRKLLGIQKTESEIINEQIEGLRQQLGRSSFADVIKINQQIAVLYRKYQQNLFVSKSNNIDNSSHVTVNNSSVVKKQTPFQRNITNTSGVSHFMRSSLFSPMKKTSKARSEAHASSKRESLIKDEKMVQIQDLMIMKELNESQEAQSKDNYDIDDQHQFNEKEKEGFLQPQSMIIQNYIHKMKRRTSQFGNRRRVFTMTDSKQKQKEVKKQRMITTITESFVNRQVIEKGRNLDKTLRDNQEVSDIWKNKINDNYEKNAQAFIKFQPKVKKFKKSIKKEKVSEVKSEQVDLDEKRMKQRNHAERLAEIRQETAQKERVFSIIIKKKQSKYKRLPGTQILHQVDANEIAKMYLGTTQRQKSKRSSRQNNTSCQHNVVQGNNPDVPEWMDMGYGQDQSFYWSMCRNQKINLLLKHHKK